MSIDMFRILVRLKAVFVAQWDLWRIPDQQLVLFDTTTHKYWLFYSDIWLMSSFSKRYSKKCSLKTKCYHLTSDGSVRDRLRSLPFFFYRYNNLFDMKKFSQVSDNKKSIDVIGLGNLVFLWIVWMNISCVITWILFYIPKAWRKRVSGRAFCFRACSM